MTNDFLKKSKIKGTSRPFYKYANVSLAAPSSTTLSNCLPIRSIFTGGPWKSTVVVGVSLISLT